MFTRETLQGKFEKVKDYMDHELNTVKGRCAKTVNKFRQELELGWNDLREINKKDMKTKIRDRDTRMWRTDMQEKDTLKWYREGKKDIQYDQCYRSSLSSKILAKARTNTLQVEEVIQRRSREHDKTCRLCGAEEEDLKHFMIECPSLERK